MKLQYRLEETVEIEGVTYPINLSFDTVLRLFDLLKDPVLTESEKIVLGLQLLLGVSFLCEIETQNTIFLSILEMFDIWEKPKSRYDRNGKKLKPKMKEIADQHFSFDYDAPNIYAAFYQAYGIDLFDQRGKMRWEKFIALFGGLPDETRFRQIVSIRTKKMPTGKGNKEAKDELRKLKKLYALPKEGEEDEQK
ncbi:bacteriophage Gp15 family protein [Enterococcus casseliflavus]|uniref:Gp15 family bacteriophage protein n=1 Tax=Enterococcus casseliflavus TaxID=37734 RepID=UPI002DB943CD|nr:Gp15 family bacteriophage protein [Enterococcus casseliflavus]MEB6179693.1 bacteriophage Gp15 family protein [Enterococcus casseliflavus]